MGRSLLADIKDFVRASIERRTKNELPGASDAWRLGTSLSAYLRQLDEFELKSIRRHTYHFTGDNYQRYLFGSASDRDAILAQMRSATAGLGGFTLDEGEHGIGYDTELGRISFDLIRYVSVVADLAAGGAIKRDDRKALIEIGGGYGGLARAVISYAPSSSYVICDLEEMLFCSAVYLSNTCGSERVHLAEGGVDVSAMQPGHFYLVPQIDLERLTGPFDIAINQQSMQEMERGQVERYCDFFARHVSTFYSRNLTSLESMGNADFLGHFKLVKDLNGFLKHRFPVLWVGPASTADAGDAHLERLLLKCRP